MMYYRSYGNAEMAIDEFAKLPDHIRNNIDSIDYSAAESRCPRNLEIGKIMKDAVKILA
jgi:predicted aldo/keto reductase-like oxidoreductase